MAGWTLPYQMGVKVLAANAPLEAKLELLEKVVPPAGRVEGGGGWYLISAQNNNSFIAANRIFKKGGQVLRAQDSFTVGRKTYPAGTWVVPSGSVSGSVMDSLAKELYLDIGTAGAVSAKTSRVKVPRIALYKSWVASMDEGWTRWMFEKYEFPFTNIYDDEVRAGDLGKKYDVLVIPANGAEAIVNGNRQGTIPPQYVGGITEAGVRNIKDFVEGGGTLVTLRQASMFAIEKLDIPVKDALAGLQASERRDPTVPSVPAKFACPGSLLKTEFNTTHPVAYGMPAEAPGMFYGGTAFDVPASSEGKGPQVVAKYPGGDLLMSGYLLGEQYLKNKAAAVDVPLGKGRVILLGFAVQNRAQPHGTFKLLFNSIYYGATQ